MKINQNLFCISLGLHYLSPLEKVLSFGNEKEIYFFFLHFAHLFVPLQAEKI